MQSLFISNLNINLLNQYNIKSDTTKLVERGVPNGELMTTNNKATEFESILKDHPRLLGMLFGATVLLGQVGSVAANNAHNAGP
jgi:hypothetical protein